MPEKVRFWLMQGNLSAAKCWAKDKEKLDDLTAKEQVTIARVERAAQAAKRIDQALRRLAALRSSAERQGLNGLLIEILLLEASLVLAGLKTMFACSSMKVNQY